MWADKIERSTRAPTGSTSREDVNMMYVFSPHALQSCVQTRKRPIDDATAPLPTEALNAT